MKDADQLLKKNYKVIAQQCLIAKVNIDATFITDWEKEKKKKPFVLYKVKSRFGEHCISIWSCYSFFQIKPIFQSSVLVQTQYKNPILE